MAKTARMDLRLHPDDDALIRRAADHGRESVTAFVARVARREAEQVLLDRSFAILDADEYDELEARLDHAPPPGERLLSLMSRADPWAHGQRRHQST